MSYFLFINWSKEWFAMVDEDLSKLFDACGKPVGGGSKHCPKCNIHFSLYCGYVLQNITKEYPVKCPMSDGELN